MKISDTPNTHPHIIPTHPFLWEKSDPTFLRKFRKLNPPIPFIKGVPNMTIHSMCLKREKLKIKFEKGPFLVIMRFK